MLTATPGERDDEDEGKDSLPASKSNLGFLIAGSSTSCFNTFFILLMISLDRVAMVASFQKLKSISCTSSRT